MRGIEKERWEEVVKEFYEEGIGEENKEEEDIRNVMVRKKEGIDKGKIWDVKGIDYDLMEMLKDEKELKEI